MEGGQKVAVAVVLIIVIVGVVAYTVFKKGGEEPDEAQLSEADRRPVTKICDETFELITKTLGEWKELGVEGGKYKNPSTQQHTMCGINRDLGYQLPEPDVGPEGSHAEMDKALEASKEKAKALGKLDSLKVTESGAGGAP